MTEQYTRVTIKKNIRKAWILALKHRNRHDLERYDFYMHQYGRWLQRLQPVRCYGCPATFANEQEYSLHLVKARQHLSEELPEWRCPEDLREEERYEQEIDIAPGQSWRWNGADRGECGGYPHPAE